MGKKVKVIILELGKLMNLLGQLLQSLRKNEEGKKARGPGVLAMVPRSRALTGGTNMISIRNGKIFLKYPKFKEEKEMYPVVERAFINQGYTKIEDHTQDNQGVDYVFKKDNEIVLVEVKCTRREHVNRTFSGAIS